MKGLSVCDALNNSFKLDEGLFEGFQSAKKTKAGLHLIDDDYNPYTSAVWQGEVNQNARSDICEIVLPLCRRVATSTWGEPVQNGGSANGGAHPKSQVGTAWGNSPASSGANGTANGNAVVSTTGNGDDNNTTNSTLNMDTGSSGGGLENSSPCDEGLPGMAN